MKFDIKARLAHLEMYHYELVKLINDAGIKALPCDFSCAINEIRKTPKNDRICIMADRILRQIENGKEWRTND